MGATVTLNETNGASPTETAGISNLNFGSIDAPNLNPATYPIKAQANGASFEKWLRLSVTSMGGSVQLDNIQVWMNVGVLVTGEQIMSNLKTSAYVAATYPTGTGPSEATSLVATTAIPTSQPAGANMGIGGSLSGTITASPAYSDWIVLQEQVTGSTPVGAVNQKTFTFQWDEV